MSPKTSGSDLNSPSSLPTDPHHLAANSSSSSHITPPPASSVTSSRSSNTSPVPKDAIPKSILIVGAGVFGLSTALALTKRQEFASTAITVVDRSPEPGVFPARDASSIDVSRIIRADYSDPAYAALAAEAQEEWRKCSHPDDLGAEGRYGETGLMLVADEEAVPQQTQAPSGKNKKKTKTGLDYVRSSLDNVRSLYADSPKITELPTQSAIKSAYGTGGSTGTYGYLNGLSGWADAEASMAWLHRRVVATGRVTFINGTVTSLLYSPDAGNPFRVQGVRLQSSSTQDAAVLTADLTILATGAWTPSLVQDLSGRAVSTGQVLAYMDLTPAEQERLRSVPTLLNLSTGYFIITPSRNTLKVARHAYGYLNPTTPSTSTNVAEDGFSLPVTHLTRPSLAVPPAEQKALRQAIREMIPWPELHDRPFTSTKLCWYTDTPDGDFIIDYHPRHEGLFLATGGSGHGFKFLPVIGARIVDCVLGRCPQVFEKKWKFAKGAAGRRLKRWDQVVTEDGSRGGVPGLILDDEIRRDDTTKSRL